MNFMTDIITNKEKMNTAVVLILSVVISSIGIIVQMEWGKALSQTTVNSELVANIGLLVAGLILCGALMALARGIGRKNCLRVIVVLTGLLMILTCTPLASSETGVRLLHIGPAYFRFMLIVPLAFVLVASQILDLYAETDRLMMVLTMTAVTVLGAVAVGLYEHATRLWYTLPIMAYCLMFPYLKKYTWYRRLPWVFVLLFAVRVIYVWVRMQNDVYSFRDRAIAAWLHPHSEEFAADNFMRNEILTMVKGAGLLGNRSAMAADNTSYLISPDLILIGLIQRFGYVGLLVTSLLYAEMCRRIYKKGTDLAGSGVVLQGALCKGIGLYLALAAILSLVSQLYLLPMKAIFGVPFLCSGGFQPTWYLYLAVALLPAGKGDAPSGKGNQEEKVAPASEPTELEEETAPASEPTELEEETAPASEPAELEEKTAPASESTGLEEKTAPASELTGVEEKTAPASESAGVEEKTALASEPTELEEETAPASEPTELEEETAPASEPAGLEEKTALASEPTELKEKTE